MSVQLQPQSQAVRTEGRRAAAAESPLAPHADHHWPGWVVAFLTTVVVLALVAAVLFAAIKMRHMGVSKTVSSTAQRFCPSVSLEDGLPDLSNQVIHLEKELHEAQQTITRIASSRDAAVEVGGCAVCNSRLVSTLTVSPPHPPRNRSEPVVLRAE